MCRLFESNEAVIRRSEFDIKLFFRGFIKDDPKKVICISQSP